MQMFIKELSLRVILIEKATRQPNFINFLKLN